MKMNNFRTIAMAVAAMLLAAACSRPAYEMPLRYRPDPELKILNDIKDQTIIPPGGGQGVIEVDTELDLIASPQRPWLEVKVEGNKVYFSAPANISIESRYSNLTIVAEDKSSTFISIQQLGYISAGKFSVEDIKLLHGVQEVSVPYDYPYPITASTEADWIDFEIKSDELKIKVTLNDGTQDRQATVNWELGIQSGSFKVFQYCEDNEPAAFKKVKAWTPKYAGRNGDGNDEFGVDVADGSDEGKYFFYVISAAAWVTAGGEDTPEYLEAVAAEGLATNPAFYTKSATELVAAVPYATYRVYAFGVDDSGAAPKINHKYAVAEVRVEKQMSPYEKWLGTWSVPRGTSSDTWTIIQNVADASYTITGMEGEDIEVAAQFNPADGSLSVDVQDDLGTATTPDGDAKIGIYGLIAYQGDTYFITGNYTIFVAKMGDGGKATIVAGGTDGKINISGIGECDLVEFMFGAMVGKSVYTFSETAYGLPVSITRLTSGAASKKAPRSGLKPFRSNFGAWKAF